jgi:hypothetical protein
MLFFVGRIIITDGSIQLCGGGDDTIIQPGIKWDPYHYKKIAACQAYSMTLILKGATSTNNNTT